MSEVGDGASRGREARSVTHSPILVDAAGAGGDYRRDVLRSVTSRALLSLRTLLGQAAITAAMC
jgi:hypothetical protein